MINIDIMCVCMCVIPDVFREAVFDEFFIFVLIETHEDGVISYFGSGFEVEHHFSPKLTCPGVSNCPLLQL